MSSASRFCIVAFTVATLLLARGQVEACTCAGGTSPEGELEQADAVFVATVGNIERQSRRQIVQMTVTRAFKGVTTGASIEVHTGLGGGDCGIKFARATSWLVYASRSGRLPYNEDPGYAGLRTIPCSRTTPIELAKADLDALAVATAGKTKAPAASASQATPNVSAVMPSAEPPTIASTPPTPTSPAMPSAVPTATPGPASRSCAWTAGPASFGPYQAGLIALALLLQRRRRAYTDE